LARKNAVYKYLIFYFTLQLTYCSKGQLHGCVYSTMVMATAILGVLWPLIALAVLHC